MMPELKRKSKKLPVAISEEEFTELIKHTKKKHHRLAFLLGYGCGLRVSEILHLQSRHINEKDKTILIEQGKGKKDRIAPLPKGYKQEHVTLLPIRCGKRALEIAFKRNCKKAGLLEKKPTLHFHSLRHGFATNCIQKGIPISHIKTMLGHSNISTTSIYLEMNPKEALRSYEELF